MLAAGQSPSGAATNERNVQSNDATTPANNTPGSRITPSTLPLTSQPSGTALAQTAAISEETIEIVPGFCVSFLEADQILEDYRSNMLSQFPFVPIPFTKSQDIYHSQPLLVKAIIYASRPQNAPMTDKVNRWFREYFAHHIVVLNEKSLEILQAILVFLAWREVEFFINAYDTSLLHLALGLVGDLGMNRFPEDQTIPSYPESIADAGLTTAVRGFNVRVVHTHAHRRAMLGLFYITSNIWTLFRRTEPPGYTDYAEKCCLELKQTPEYSSDQLLTGMVDLQRLVLQACVLGSKMTTTTRQEVLDTPRNMLVSSQQNWIEETFTKLPQNIRFNHVIRSHYYTALIRLHESTIYLKPSNAPDGPLTRTQSLWACLENANLLLTSAPSTPVDVFSKSLFSMTAHVAFAHLTLTRLLFLNDACWDAAAARKSIDYPGLVERLADYFDTADRARGGRQQTAVHEHAEAQSQHGKKTLSRAERLRWARTWYLSKSPIHETATTSMLGSAMNEPPSTAYLEAWGTSVASTYWQTLFDTDFGI
ncbi:hypothetical protein PFICI_10566 [Pestalotiopsis fici W106-1]|uniref:Transcription factor domain-containing protein n=1 Tax=Pestalotiopsis fici (strain W106-1 / CGMCC3.15140) TaxID=1229662 RepID=W3WXI3_PESFW|nr:uncharacterized protein PFICI_10566 [Pestalotiopsis fici W106-1]ETS78504.1 hypothetical protein PFICI_10566 [Pestalotiopsis fici W106-1]